MAGDIVAEVAMSAVGVTVFAGELVFTVEVITTLPQLLPQFTKTRRGSVEVKLLGVPRSPVAWEGRQTKVMFVLRYVKLPSSLIARSD